MIYKNCPRCKSIFFSEQCLSCFPLEENKTAIWDWKLNPYVCKKCDKEFISEKDVYNGFIFCKECYSDLINKINLLFYDYINPKRLPLSKNCINKDYHYETICTFGTLGECNCRDCGITLKYCDCKKDI